MGYEMTQGRHAPCLLLDVLDTGPWLHLGHRLYLLKIGFDAMAAGDVA
jgi:hypothetical protein